MCAWVRAFRRICRAGRATRSVGNIAHAGDDGSAQHRNARFVECPRGKCAQTCSPTHKPDLRTSNPVGDRSRALRCRPGGRQPVQLSRESRNTLALDPLWSSNYQHTEQPPRSSPTARLPDRCRRLDRKLAPDSAGVPAVRRGLLSLVSVPDDQCDGRRLIDRGIWPRRWRSWSADVCLLPDFRGCPDLRSASCWTDMVQGRSKVS